MNESGVLDVSHCRNSGLKEVVTKKRIRYEFSPGVIKWNPPRLVDKEKCQ